MSDRLCSVYNTNNKANTWVHNNLLDQHHACSLDIDTHTHKPRSYIDIFIQASYFTYVYSAPQGTIPLEILNLNNTVTAPGLSNSKY